MKGAKLENQKPKGQLKDYEEEANRLKAVGNIAGALETLDEAIAIEKRWYHLLTKACWLYELEKFPESWEAIQEGLSRFPTYRFWYFYLRAHYRYLKVNTEISKNPDIQAVIKESIESKNDIDTALEILAADKDNIKRDLENPPLLFPQNWKDCDVNDIINKVQNLRNEILSLGRTLNLLSNIEDVQDDFKKTLKEQNQAAKIMELEHQSNLAQYNAEINARLEQSKLTNQAGQSALRACVFLNAGSAVALLAFLNVLTKNESDIGGKIIYAITFFASGALAGSISTGFTYLALYASTMDRYKLGHCVNLIANGMVLLSYDFFIIGAYLALAGIAKRFDLYIIPVFNWIAPLILLAINIGSIILFYKVLKIEKEPKATNTDKAKNG